MHVGVRPDADEQVAARFDRISDRSDETVPESGSEQGRNEVGKAFGAPVSPGRRRRGRQATEFCAADSAGATASGHREAADVLRKLALGPLHES